MIRVSVQVRNGPAQFRVVVQAESVERALEIAKRHNPTRDCRVVFPIDPETFFAGDDVARTAEIGKLVAA